MMLKQVALVAFMGILSAIAGAQAKDAPPAKTPGPAKTAKDTAAPPAPRVVATVGKTKIMSDKVDKYIAGAPKGIPLAQLAAAKERFIGQLVETALFQAYINALPCTDKDIEDLKKDIAKHVKKTNLTRSKDQQITVEKFMTMQGITKKSLPEAARSFKFGKRAEKAGSKEAVDAFVKASPVTYFDGTQAKASHILLACSPHASPEARKKVTDQLRQIAKDIAAKKVSFAEAAKKSSTCPSKAKGGDLGSFTFGRMVAPFSRAAFAMKVGQVSDVVETQFGFHIIKLTKLTPGSGKVGPGASQTAKRILMARFHTQILAAARKANPVKILE